jgi:hypothetical protein
MLAEQPIALGGDTALVWEEKSIEAATREALIQDHGKESGTAKYSLYEVTRHDLVCQVLDQIAKVLPQYTDHGIPHVQHVLRNVGCLLDGSADGLNSSELYCLITAVLFHDAGMVDGREGHQRHIYDIYDFVRSEANLDPHEKLLIMKAVEAHCTESSDVPTDPLACLEDETHLFDKAVNLRRIAAILRFADELAEGPHRTSRFMLLKHGIQPDAEIHHRYSEATRVFIDRHGERIALNYYLTLDREVNGRFGRRDQASLRELLDYIYHRIIKLDQERRYTRHHADLLAPFLRTEAAFFFSYEGRFLDIPLEPLGLSDFVLPGEKDRPIPDRYPHYRVPDLMKTLHNAIKGGR